SQKVEQPVVGGRVCLSRQASDDCCHARQVEREKTVELRHAFKQVVVQHERLAGNVHGGFGRGENKIVQPRLGGVGNHGPSALQSRPWFEDGDVARQQFRAHHRVDVLVCEKQI